MDLFHRDIHVFTFTILLDFNMNMQLIITSFRKIPKEERSALKWHNYILLQLYVQSLKRLPVKLDFHDLMHKIWIICRLECKIKKIMIIFITEIIWCRNHGRIVLTNCILQSLTHLLYKVKTQELLIIIIVEINISDEDEELNLQTSRSIDLISSSTI